MRDGIWQHAWCGTLASVPETKAGGASKLGRCPYIECEKPEQDWWEQTLPVGPFTNEGRAMTTPKNWSKSTLLKRLADTILEVSPEAQSNGDTAEQIMLTPDETILAEMNAAELVELIRSAVIVEAIKR